MSPEDSIAALNRKIELLSMETARAIAIRGKAVDVDAPPFAFQASAAVIQFYNGLDKPRADMFRRLLSSTLSSYGFSIQGPFALANLEVRRDKIGKQP